MIAMDLHISNDSPLGVEFSPSPLIREGKVKVQWGNAPYYRSCTIYIEHFSRVLGPCWDREYHLNLQ